MRVPSVGVAMALLATAASPVEADCLCRAPGIIAHHGQTVCINTPSGVRLARCEMVLNNSSWTFLAEPCPQASRQSRRNFASTLPAAPVAALVR